MTGGGGRLGRGVVGGDAWHARDHTRSGPLCLLLVNIVSHDNLTSGPAATASGRMPSNFLATHVTKVSCKGRLALVKESEIRDNYDLHVRWPVGRLAGPQVKQMSTVRQIGRSVVPIMVLRGAYL